MGDLARHFDLAEFSCHGTPVPQELRRNVENLARLVLDPIRDRFGAVKITSGYRTPEYNEELRARGVSASRTSQHMEAAAADFGIRGDTRSQDSLEVVRWLVAEGQAIPWDQAIWYDDSKGGHVHVSWASKPRHQALHALSGGGYAHWDPVAGEGVQAQAAGAVRQVASQAARNPGKVAAIAGGGLGFLAIILLLFKRRASAKT